MALSRRSFDLVLAIAFFSRLVDARQQVTVQQPVQLPIGQPVAVQQQQLPPAQLPLDVGDLTPEVPVTEDTLKKANMDAFVQEIIRDEDARITVAASAAATQLATKRAEQAAEEAEVKRTAAEATRQAEAAQAAAAGKLSDATAEVVKEVARRAALAGQREQLARDQQVIAELLRQQASAASASSGSAIEEANKARLMAAAAKQVSEEMASGAEWTKINAAKSSAKAQADAQAVWRKVAEATQQMDTASDMVTKTVNATGTAIGGLKVAAQTALTAARKDEQKLAGAIVDPAAFVKGVSEGIAAGL